MSAAGKREKKGVELGSYRRAGTAWKEGGARGDYGAFHAGTARGCDMSFGAAPLPRERKRRNLNRSRTLLDLAEGTVVATMEARGRPASLDLPATCWDMGGR